MSRLTIEATLKKDLKPDSIMGRYLVALALWVENEGKKLFQQMFEGVRFRERMLNLYQPWKNNRSDLWRETNLSDEQKNSVIELSVTLESLLSNLKRAGDRCVPDWEKINIMQLILVNVYGISLEMQSWLDDEDIKPLTESLPFKINPENFQPNQLVSIQLEHQVLNAYKDDYQSFQNRYREEMGDLASQSTTPGTTRRSIYLGVLYAMYNFDPRQRQRLLAPTTDETAIRLQERLLQEELACVADVIDIVEKSKTGTIDYGKYL